ncbi:DNA-directed RNA polymerase III, subunit Rpc31 [Trichophaea hybrida]|nr:DNA-directed RNA polymerase III, subunit Rpc31 [Trichophaea hybrida]
MSRGGRGGGFGGRGGRGGGGMGGGPFGGDDIKPDYSVTELFPPQPPPVQSALSKEERAMVQRYRSHREKIHNGPLYTVMVTKRGASNDPFNGVARYSEKYKKKTRKAPKLDARPYVIEFFPEELYATLGVDGKTGVKEKKTLVLSALDSLLEDGVGLDEDADGEEEKKKEEEEDVEDVEEEEEDDFMDDDEGDYNAEQYFSGGSDISDMGDDDDGGGGYY